MNKRLPGVDFLRGLSILAVILLHINIRMRIHHVPMKGVVPEWLMHFVFWNGNNGVTVFFAVSGFLITLTSLKRFGSLAALRPAIFYRIRFARIAPLLLALLAVLSALHLAGIEDFVIDPARATLARALVAALTFHLNWLEAARGYLPPCWDVLWSLSVEEMFYLFFPLVCVTAMRWRFGAWLLALFVVVGPFARAWAGSEIWEEKSYFGAMDSIAMGCITALYLERLKNGSVMIWAGWALILLIAVWPRWWIMNHVIDHFKISETILALGTCLVMAGTTIRGAAPSAWTWPIRWLGEHSYEVYLTHEFVVLFGTTAYFMVWSGPMWLWIAAIVLLSALVGAVVARFFSEPLNRRLRPNL